MQQQALWHDSIEDALKAVVISLGGPKRVGGDLWPDKPVSDAARLLNHCLDPERSEKLELSQVVWLLSKARESDCHVAMEYLGQIAGYVVEPVCPESERDRLMREFNESVRAQQRIMEGLQRIGQTVTSLRSHDRRAS